MDFEQKSQKKAWYIVFISSLMGCSISAAFPQFSMTVMNLSKVTNLSESFLLTGDTIKSASIVLAMLCSGFFYNKFGARITFIVSLICTVLPQFFIPAISSPVIFILLKIMQGFSSVIFPVFLIIIMDNITKRQAGIATAIFNGVFYSGGGIGGTIAGYFITEHGWISSYYSLGVIELVIGITWLLSVNTSVSNKETDSTSSLNKNTSPVSLLKKPVVWLLILSFISTTFVIQAITVDMPLFTGWLGYNDMQIGKMNTAVTIGLLLACLVSGKASDSLAIRMKNKSRARILVMSFGPIIIIISSIMLITFDLTSFYILYITTLLFSFGGSWGLGAFYCILPELFEDNELPIVTGLTGGAGDLGMPLAPLLIGVVFGSQGLWHLGWSVCIVIAIISLLACFTLFLRKQVTTPQ